MAQEPRNAKGQFTKPPAKRGRPKGSKNKTSLVQAALRAGAEELLFKSLDKVVRSVISQAEQGNVQAAKLLLDRALPVVKAEEGQRRQTNKFQIVITEAGPKGPQLSRGVTIEGVKGDE